MGMERVQKVLFSSAMRVQRFSNGTGHTKDCGQVTRVGQEAIDV